MQGNVIVKNHIICQTLNDSPANVNFRITA